MPNHNLMPNCTVQRSKGDFCDAPSAEDVPFPICAKHASEIYRHVRSGMTAFSKDRVFAAWHFFVEKPALEREMAADVRRADAARNAIVYYLQLGDMVKIGYTGNLKQRLGGYPPHKRLLATEPDKGGTERQRHQQFRSLLASGKEWFHPGPELLEHINGLREKAGAPLIRKFI